MLLASYAGLRRETRTPYAPKSGSRHDDVDYIMEKFEDRKKSPLQQQEKHYKAMQERHRRELDKAMQVGRNETYIDAVLKRQHQETKAVCKECSAWLAWRDLAWKRQELYDQYGVDYIPYRPEREDVPRDDDGTIPMVEPPLPPLSGGSMGVVSMA